MTPPQPDPPQMSSPGNPYLSGVPVPVAPRYRWYHKLFAVMLATGCLIIGVVLLLFPWTTAWEHNYFAGLSSLWHRWWNNLYVRGAVSGIGVVNLYISLVEVFRLKRFSQH